VLVPLPRRRLSRPSVREAERVDERAAVRERAQPTRADVRAASEIEGVELWAVAGELDEKLVAVLAAPRAAVQVKQPQPLAAPRDFD